MKEIKGDDFGSLRLWLRDGVDVYISPDHLVHFVFLSTRKRLRLRVAPALIDCLEWFDGSMSISELQARFSELDLASEGHQAVSFIDFSRYLYERGILVPKRWMSDEFPPELVARFERQLNFFLDVEGSTGAASSLFRKIRDSRVALIGVGAVGSWILKELVQIGFRRFVLVDPKKIRAADRVRNALFDGDCIGESKVVAAARHIHGQAINGEVRVVNDALDLDTDIDKLIGSDIDLIVNTADDPYIGATSIKLSRYCMEHGLPLLVAGGFDAHLASLSEMIVPGQTPCADCYAMHFEDALRSWKPAPHPVSDRRLGFGGLPTLSTFAASAAVLKIVRLLSSQSQAVEQGRGEFLFDTYQIDAFQVERNPDCPSCAGIEH